MILERVRKGRDTHHDEFHKNDKSSVQKSNLSRRKKGEEGIKRDRETKRRMFKIIMKWIRDKFSYTNCPSIQRDREAEAEAERTKREQTADRK